MGEDRYDGLYISYMKNKVIFLTGKSIAVTLICTLLLCFSFTLFAQDKSDSIITYFNVLKSIPQEKLYLHLDKPFYGAGEKIWMKGYLVNGLTHKDDAKSNFIITELVNRTDSIIQRKKIRRDSLGFQNAFTLPPTLPAGDYYLRGYSNWMLNEAPDFFYSHNLKIGNSIDNSVIYNIEYQQADGDNYMVKVKFLNNAQVPYANINVNYKFFEEGKQKDKGRKKSDEYGLIYIPLSNLKKDAKRRIELEFDDPQYIGQKTFYLPSFSKDFDVSFFPEGGHLLTINRQNIAFKAQGADGFSKEIKGYLFNAKGDTLTDFHSEHDGMGVFGMNPVSGETYYINATSADGITKRFNLPPVEQNGINIAMVHHKQEIRFEIRKTETTPWPQTLFLLGHTRGELVILQPINFEKPYGKLNDSLFNDGITHFLLVDGNGKPVSERLVFVYNKKNSPKWEIQTDKNSYGKREKITMQISAKDASQIPLTGNFSISITDKRNIRQDSLVDNILSNLLLTSDLKGYIENPSYYFQNNNSRAENALDFVMLTHGWRRHKIENVLRPLIINYTNFIEGGQTITGKIKGIFGNGVKKGPIYVMSPQRNIFEVTTTNDNGEFLVNTSFKDSTTFVIQARTKKGFAGVDILIDKPQIPSAQNKYPFLTTGIPQMEDYLANTREKYYMEGGIRVFNLKEVLITAKRRPQVSSRSIYVGVNDYTVSGDRVSGMGARTAKDVVTRLPSVMITNGNEVHIRNNPTQSIIVIDDVTYEDSDILELIQAEEIESVSLIRDASANIFGARGIGGAIVITLKDPRDFPSKPASGIITYSPLGCSDPVEFYHPTYETPDKRENAPTDLRTTIYWNPQLQLDANGTATIEYYTPDSTGPQDIVIEGIAKDGQICRFTKTINISSQP